jgi:hypothetical protein
MDRIDKSPASTRSCSTICLLTFPFRASFDMCYVQSAFGRQALSLSSFFTYVGLGLGLLGSSLALPFGLYVIICQRGAEKYIKVIEHWTYVSVLLVIIP